MLVRVRPGAPSLSLHEKFECMRHKDHQSGNVLFLILIAVALFAALTYAITNSTRGVGANTSNETNSTAFSTIQTNIINISQGLQRVRYANGCSENSISFEHANFPASTMAYGGDDTTYNNPAAPLDKRCHVFEEAGGGAYVPKPLPINQGASFSPARYKIRTGINLAGIGTTAPELLLVVGPLKDDLCRYINTKSDVTGIPLDGAIINSVHFTGSYPALSATFGITGKPFYCFNNYSPQQNYYIQSLIDR